MSETAIFTFGMLVFGVAIASSLISVIGTSQTKPKVDLGKQAVDDNARVATSLKQQHL